VNAVRSRLKNEARFVRQAVKHPRTALWRWRRVTSARTTFLERNHDTAKTMVLVGTGRSGSTWLSEVLVEAFSCRLIFEPLRRDRVPLSKAVPWGCYAAPGDADPELERVWGSILAGRIRSVWTDHFNEYRFPGRRLVKEIRATNTLPWLVSRFPEVPAIYLLRHPVAAAWSATELDWDPFLGEFLRQPRLMDGPLAPWRDVIDRHRDDPDLFHRHILRWCMENTVPIRHLAPGSVHVVFYENLVEDPHGELERLAAFLGRFGPRAWRFDPAIGPRVDRLSRANYRKTPMMPANERLQSWVGTVPDPSVDRAVALLEEFGLDRIYAGAVRPRLAPDEVLVGDVAAPSPPSLT
jgi:hypothetical protein